MVQLTKMQQRIYDYIAQTIRTQGYPPSVREIGDAVGLKSPSTVHFHLKHMEELGVIGKGAGKGRALTLTEPLPEENQIPIVGTVAAGTPILAEECIEDYLTFDAGGDSSQYFALRVRGESMLNAGILPDDLVVFAADEKYMVRLTCGDASFEIMGLSAEDYPELPEVDDEYSVAIQQGTLKAMINETRPIHTGSLFEINEQGLTMVSVDGFRLALRREPLERIDGGAFRFVAPGSALNEVEKICEDSDDLMTIIQGKRHLMFETGSTQLICRRLEGEFLDYRNAIPRNNPISILVDTKAMLNSLDRVSVVISEKLKSPVHCIFDAGRVYLSAKTGNGEAKDICPVEGDGQGLEIGFNNRFFMDALRYAPAEKVKMELNTGISPCIMTPVEGEENFLYMVLPVRLKA